MCIINRCIHCILSSTLITIALHHIGGGERDLSWCYEHSVGPVVQGLQRSPIDT